MPSTASAFQLTRAAPGTSVQLAPASVVYSQWVIVESLPCVQASLTCPSPAVAVRLAGCAGSGGEATQGEAAPVPAEFFARTWNW